MASLESEGRGRDTRGARSKGGVCGGGSGDKVSSALSFPPHNLLHFVVLGALARLRVAVLDIINGAPRKFLPFHISPPLFFFAEESLS